MARIAGVDLPKNKKVKIGLTYIFGIGHHTAARVLTMAKVDPEIRVSELNDDQVMKISSAIDSNIDVEGELRQVINKNIRRLKEIKSYRGTRHKLGLPTRGQRTRSNAVTRKGKNLAVGGLNPKITKK